MWLYSCFSITWWDGHVGVQNNGKMSLKFCIMIKSNSWKYFFRYCSVHQHGCPDVTWKPRIGQVRSQKPTYKWLRIICHKMKCLVITLYWKHANPYNIFRSAEEWRRREPCMYTLNCQLDREDVTLIVQFISTVRNQKLDWYSAVDNEQFTFSYIY